MKDQQHRPTYMVVYLGGLAVLLILSISTTVSAANAGSLNFSLADVQDFHSSFTNKEPNSRYSLLLSEPPSSSALKALKTGVKEHSQSSKDIFAVNNQLTRNLYQGGPVPASSLRINYMDIKLDKITVIAINLARGGSAAANSNIVIQPVQTSGGCVQSSPLDDLLK